MKGNQQLLSKIFLQELQAMEGRLKESLDKKDDDKVNEAGQDKSEDESSATPFIDIYVSFSYINHTWSNSNLKPKYRHKIISKLLS